MQPMQQEPVHRMRPARRSRIAFRLLLLAATLGALVVPSPLAAQTHDTTRPLPSACTPFADRIAPGLREASRRLDRTPDRPGADRERAVILAESLAAPRTNAALADLLACLTRR